MNQTFVLNGIDGKPKGEGRPENQEDDRPEGNPKEMNPLDPKGSQERPLLRAGSERGRRRVAEELRGTPRNSEEATSTPNSEVFGLVASERGLF